MSMRFDTFQFAPARKTREGFLICRAYCAKAGVLVYTAPDGTKRRELVLPEELSRADSLASIDFSPITDDHPPVMLSSENAAAYSRGVVLTGSQYAAGYVETEIMIQDQDLIDLVESGKKRELSAGYELEELVEESGVHPEFGEYDAIQRGRICNHIAVVERGRAGPTVSVRVDSTDKQPKIYTYREDTMPKEQDAFADLLSKITTEIQGLSSRIDALGDEDAGENADEDGGEVNEALQEVANAMAGVVEQLEAIKAEAKDKQDKHDALKGQLDALMAEFKKKEDADAQDTDKTDARNDSQDATKERLDWYNVRRDLEEHASKYKLDSEAIKDLDNAGLRREIVKAHAGEGYREDASDAQIEGAFDMIKAIRSKRDGSYQDASEIAANAREDAAAGGEQTAAEKYRERQLNAWRGDK